jgi:hypothetical protein
MSIKEATRCTALYFIVFLKASSILTKVSFLKNEQKILINFRIENMQKEVAKLQNFSFLYNLTGEIITFSIVQTYP